MFDKLFARRPPPRRPSMPPPAAAAPACAGEPASRDAEPRGCGWFDSSHDLRTGLCAIELALESVWPDADADQASRPAW